jgi:outer membrane receptor protein involved in Fe transport
MIVRVLLLAAGLTPAELPPGPVETVEVSATRLERTGEDTALRVERLEEHEVAEGAGSLPSLAVAVQQLPGIGAVGRDAYTAAPTIRGLGRDRSIILLEGMRLSSDRGVGPSGSFVDPFLLRSLAVVRGAAGVAYGSGAMGGVLNVGLGPVDPDPGAALRLGGTTNGAGALVAGRAHRSLGENWRAAGGAFWRTVDDYSFPDGFLGPGGDATNSGLSHGGGTLVFERPLRRGEVRFAGLATTADEIGRPLTTPQRLDTIESEDHLLGSARWQRDVEGRRDEWTAGAHRPRTVNRTERFDDAGARTRTGRVENVSTDLSASGLRERPAGDGSWFLGVDAFSRLGVDATETTVRYVDGVEQPTERQELVKDALRFDLGAFGGWKRPFGRRGEALLAGRLDWARRNANDRSSADWVAPSLTAGLVYPVSPSWALTGTAGRSFRAPRIQELYFEGDRPGGSRLANPGLEPETAWSLEAGVRGERGRWSGSASVWGLWASDLIVQLPVDAAGDTLRFENAAKGRLAGAEASVAWRSDAGRTHASAAYAIRLSADTRVAGEPAGRNATIWGTLRAGAAKTPPVGGEEERWWSGLLGASPVGGDEVGHPGFARWDVGVRGRLADRVTLDISIVNLLDSHSVDRPEADTYPSPGRSLRAELTLGE